MDNITKKKLSVCVNILVFIYLYLDHLWVLFPDVCMVIASEIAVDVVKHAFITKFNDITADVSKLSKEKLLFFRSGMQIMCGGKACVGFHT